MRSLKDSLIERSLYNYFENIDTAILCETLQEPHLKELAKYIYNVKTDRKKAGAYSNSKLSFKSLFGQYRVRWDKITENDFKKFSAGDKEGIKLAKSCLKNDNDFNDVLILWVDDTDNIIYFANRWGLWKINRGKIYTDYDWHTNTEFQVPERPSKITDDRNKLRQTDIKGYCDKYNFMILNLHDANVDSSQTIADRNIAKRGIIDPSMYSEIARENKRRYKQIIAQNKAEKIAKNDTISEEVQRVLDEAMVLSSEVMKGGSKYADLSWEMSHLLEAIHSERVYTGDYRYGKTGYIGQNGLLVLYKNYLKTNMESARSTKSAYGSTEDASKWIKSIEDKIKSIDDSIKDIYARMN